MQTGLLVVAAVALFSNKSGYSSGYCEVIVRHVYLYTQKTLHRILRQRHSHLHHDSHIQRLNMSVPTPQC